MASPQEPDLEGQAALTRPGASAGPAAPSQGTGALHPVPPGRARITGGWWGRRQRANGARAVPSGHRRLEEAGNLGNVRAAAAMNAGEPPGEVRGPIFMDSDLHKWLEAAAWELGRAPTPVLLAQVREVTASVAAAQADDGYLDSVAQVRGAGPGGAARYADLPWSHELYCAGHLLQAAVAQSRAVGDGALLAVAVRLADHLVTTFGDGPGQLRDVDGHPVVEMGLVEMFRETGQRRYLDLARWFVAVRGSGIIAAHGQEATYFSDRVPVREAVTVEGHAVRAVYLAAGATDVAVETGDRELLAALEVQFAHMVATKSYLTGGLGARWEGEAFGAPHELPTDRAYAETCAAIGGVQWAWRMLLATGDASYADAVERTLFNGLCSGVSLTGDEYFYVNPLQVRDGAEADTERSPLHGRRGWFDTACCPPNVMRTLASLDGYLATTTQDGVQVHQWSPSRIEAQVAGGTLALEVVTDYPFDGRVRVVVDEAPRAPLTLSLRVPGWAVGASASVLAPDGGLAPDAGEVAASPGTYAVVSRVFAPGESVVLDLPMSPRRTAPHPRDDGARGCTAIERGPLVYAVEQVDAPPGAVVDDLVVPVGAELTEVRREDLLPAAAGEVVTVRIGGAHRGGDGELAPVTFTAIPYALWANRAVGPMRVWFPER